MRLSLATPNISDTEQRDSDSWGTNVFLEKETELLVARRPGLTLTYDGTSPGQGVFIWPNTTDPSGSTVVTAEDDTLWFSSIDPETGTVTIESGWDFGDGSDPSGVPVTIPGVPTVGWSLVAGSPPLTVDETLPLMLLNGNLAQLDTGIYGQNIYQSSNGTSWSGSSWPGPAYELPALGWYDGTYIWSVTSIDNEGWLFRLDPTAQSVIGSDSLASFYWGGYDGVQTFIFGSSVCMANPNETPNVVFAASSTGTVAWTEFTSNLPKADVAVLQQGYAIVILGSTAYALPRGGAFGKKVYSSTDFATWTLVTSDWGLGSSQLVAVARQAYAGKIVVLLDNDNVASTTDGSTWVKSDFIPVITGTFAPYSLCKFGSYWYTAGGSYWARLPTFRVP